jgi:hypothetical protein
LSRSIACPTCNLVNDGEESSCRRCFTPLVVTVRNGIAGGTKAYSRRFIEMANRGGNFSLPRIAAGCLILLAMGILLHRASIRLGKESPRVEISQPRVARILQLSTKYEGDRLLVTNNDNFDWPVVELVINTQSSDSPEGQNCCWTFILPQIKSHQTESIDFKVFKNRAGTPNDLKTNRIRNLQVSCFVNSSLHKAVVRFN